MEGIHVLSDDSADNIHTAEAFYSHVSSIGSCSVQVGPTQEASSPVSLPGLMIRGKLIVVDRSVGFVQGVCSSRPSVIGKARGDRDTGSGEEDCLSTSIS